MKVHDLSIDTIYMDLISIFCFIVVDTISSKPNKKQYGFLHFPAQRQVGETSLNDTSSRSHQIIRLVMPTILVSQASYNYYFY